MKPGDEFCTIRGNGVYLRRAFTSGTEFHPS